MMNQHFGVNLADFLHVIDHANAVRQMWSAWSLCTGCFPTQLISPIGHGARILRRALSAYGGLTVGDLPHPRSRRSKIGIKTEFGGDTDETY